MSQHHIAIAHPGWSGDPATGDAAFKQFVGIRCVIQESDRPHGAESGCVEHLERVRRHRNDNVVSELILSHDIHQLSGRFSGKRPKHRLFKRPNRFDFFENIGRHLDYEKNYLTEAEYRDGRNISGVRSTRNYLSMLKTLKAHFANKRLRSLTYGDLREFKLTRLRTKSQRGDELLAISSVDRELSMLRRMLSVARQQRCILYDLFRDGESLKVGTSLGLSPKTSYRV